LCNIDIGKSEEIFKRIKELADSIKKEFDAEVYLFGSFAKDEFNEGSDIDIIVVGNFEGKMPVRIGKILEMTDLPIEPLCYTYQEFNKLKRENSFIKDILKQAKKL